jgi:hypothetical protein
LNVDSHPTARSRKIVAFLLRHGRALWAIAIVLATLGTIRTVSLYAHLRSELEQLLPRSAPSVLAIDELRQRVSGLQYLGVVVDVGQPENLAAGERLLDDLAAKVRAYPPELVRTVRLGDAEERAFLEKNAALYLETDDLKTVLQRIEARRDWEVSHATGASLDDDDAPALDFSDIEKKYESRTKGRGKLEHQRFSNADLRTTLLLIEAGSFSTGQGRGAQLLHRVKADIAALGGPEAYAAGMRLGY